jgi:uncharacterized membrane protein YdjX (TVP38/TMEM64 family)
MTAWNGAAERKALPWLYAHKKKVLAALLFVAAVALARYLHLRGLLELETLFTFLQAHPVSAPVIFIAVYALSSSLILPTLPFNLAAGFFWGTLWGGVYAAAGSILGCLSAFAIARSLLGQLLRRRFSSGVIAWLQQKLDESGWVIVAFVRMNPIFPAPVNFCFGLTSIRFNTYLWSTTVFLLPPVFFFAYAGSKLSHWVAEGGSPGIVFDAMVLSLGITLITVLTLLLKFQLGRGKPSNLDKK